MLGQLIYWTDLHALMLFQYKYSDVALLARQSVRHMGTGIGKDAVHAIASWACHTKALLNHWNVCRNASALLFRCMQSFAQPSQPRTSVVAITWLFAKLPKLVISSNAAVTKDRAAQQYNAAWPQQVRQGLPDYPELFCHSLFEGCVFVHHSLVNREGQWTWRC